MPDTFIESTFKGRNVCKIYTGEYMGESQYIFIW
jgi:hypothetical protein